jgi:hypothetical protein
MMDVMETYRKGPGMVTKGRKRNKKVVRTQEELVKAFLKKTKERLEEADAAHA